MRENGLAGNDPELTMYESGLAAAGDRAALESMLGATVVIIGATGMLGTATIGALSALQHATGRRLDIHGIARSRAPETASVTFHQGAADDAATYVGLPSPDFVIYIAGTTSDYLERASETVQTGVTGVLRCLEYARGCAGFVLISSTRVYGSRNQEAVLSETTPACIELASPDNIYDSTKHLAESLVALGAHNTDLPATIARLTNLYGPKSARPESTIIGSIVLEAARTGQVRLRGHPQSARNYCFVTDAVAGILRALVRGKPGEAYNIGSYEQFTNEEFVSAVTACLPWPTQIVASPNLAEGADTRRTLSRVSIDKAVAELGYLPRAKMADGLPETVEWTRLTLRPALENTPAPSGRA